VTTRPQVSRALHFGYTAFLVDRRPSVDARTDSICTQYACSGGWAMTARLPNHTGPSFAPPSDVMRVADLLEREKQLTEELGFASDASYRRRVDIEEKLAEISRELTRLGFSTPT
jgi:hypothetical protein